MTVPDTPSAPASIPDTASRPQRSLTALQRAEARYAAAKARLSSARNRQLSEDRKRDTRRKIILGGALIDLAGRDDSARELLERLLRHLPREQDQKVFDGWAVPDRGPSAGEDPA